MLSCVGPVRCRLGSVQEVDFAAVQMVNGARDQELSIVLERFEDGTVFPDAFHRPVHVGFGYLIGELRRIDGQVGIAFSNLLHAGADFIQQGRDVSHLEIGARGTDGAAIGVSQYQDAVHLGSGPRIFQAGQNIIADDIASDSNCENASDTGVKNDLGRDAAIDAAQDRCHGVLPGSRLVPLVLQVAFQGSARREALVAFDQKIERILW